MRIRITLMPLMILLMAFIGCHSPQEPGGSQTASDSEKTTLKSVRDSDSSDSESLSVLSKLLDWDGYEETITALEVSQSDIVSLKDRAEGGDAQSCFVLARLYRRGYHLNQDDAKSVKLLKQATKHNHIKAYGCLASMYKNGLGVEKDIAKSKRLYSLALDAYRIAGDKGDAIANYQLGRIYDYGQGVEESDTIAFGWYQKAAQLGYAQAQHKLGVCYAEGIGAPKNYSLAVNWTRKAAEQKYADAQCDLGVLYEQGNGFEKNHSMAAEWFRKAAEQGLPRAQVYLGICYEEGHGVEQAPTTAIHWYRRSAKSKYALAQYSLGRCYGDGIGVERDLIAAREWFRKAASQGFEEAKQKLALADRLLDQLNANKADSFGRTEQNPISDQEVAQWLVDYASDDPNSYAAAVIQKQEMVNYLVAKPDFSVPTMMDWLINLPPGHRLRPLTKDVLVGIGQPVIPGLVKARDFFRASSHKMMIADAHVSAATGEIDMSGSEEIMFMVAEFSEVIQRIEPNTKLK